MEDEEVTFNVVKSMEFSPKVQPCNKLDDVISNKIMAKPLIEKLLGTETLKSSVSVYTAMDPPHKVQYHVPVDEQSKEIKKPSIAKPNMLKTLGPETCIPKPPPSYADLPKPIFHVYNIHSPRLNTIFYHLTYKPILRKLFELELNHPSYDFFKFEPKPTLTNKRFNLEKEG